MSREQYSKECLPVTTIRLGHITAETPEPTHIGCPGGSHRELAVIGGWTCPCACHLSGGSARNQPSATGSSAPSGEVSS